MKRKFRTLYANAVMAVLFIMFLSGFLTVAVLALLHLVNIFPALRYTPLVVIIVTAISCILIGTLLGAFVSKRILRPINELIKAMKKVAKGDFSPRIDVESAACEMEELLSSFNTMAEELSSIEMFRKDFINTFSHEFKTPIVSIRGFAKQLKNEELSPEERREYVDIIISESERLTNMSSNILLLTKFESQQIISDKSKFFLDEQIRKCILLLEKKWVGKNIAFNIDLVETEYYSNEEMLSHVWINLLENAIKFSPKDSEITVSCAKIRDDIEVRISDKGEGMDKDTMDRIFEKFYQGDSSRASDGNGLGLPLVKRIVELCGGFISVESEIGRGTDFYVYLPAGSEI